MYDYQSSFTMESKACPGVQLTLFRFTDARRRELRLATAETTAKMRRIAAESAMAQANVDALREVSAATTPTVAESLEFAKATLSVIDLDNQLREILRDEVEPAWIKHGLANMAGLTINGNLASIADLDKGPPALYREILEEIQKEIGLTDAQRKNLRSPTTSQPVAGGENGPTTAPIAETGTLVSIEAGTAASTSRTQ